MSTSQEFGANPTRCRFQFTPIDRRCGVLKTDVTHVPGRNHVKMSVRNLIAGHNQTDSLALDDRALR